MSKRCARCDALNPRRSFKPSGDWVDYLKRERDYSPVGTLVIPLCRECYADARDLPDEVDGDAAGFLNELDTDALVDEVAG